MFKHIRHEPFAHVTRLRYGGKLRRIERQLHHYGSALNAQVLLSAFRDDPTDNYLLRVGYAGSTGPLSSITEAGFASAAFHSYPDTMKWDALIGDYGPGFLGMVLGSGTYVAEDKSLGGTVAYGGVLVKDGAKVTVTTKDAVRKRVFVGPLGLTINIDAGVIGEFSYETGGSSLEMRISQVSGGPVATNATVWLESSPSSGASWKVTSEGASEGRGGWQVPLARDVSTTVQISSV